MINLEENYQPTNLDRISSCKQMIANHFDAYKDKYYYTRLGKEAIKALRNYYDLFSALRLSDFGDSYAKSYIKKDTAAVIKALDVLFSDAVAREREKIL